MLVIDHGRMRLVLACCAAIIMSLVTSPVDQADARSGPTINGGGSSFAKLMIDQWRAESARQPLSINVNYVAQGSSFGRQQLIAGNLDFAVSDIPFTAQELAALAAGPRRNFTYVPVVAGGLGFMFHLRDGDGALITDLALTRRTACRIFTEPNMRWDDPDIQLTNPDVDLPSEFIRPIVRSDGAGTSYALSEFCIAVAPDVWQEFVLSRSGDASVDPALFDGKPVSNWPQGWGRVGAQLAADGVAAAVADSSGLYSITYNEAGFAGVRGFPNASVENAEGGFTQPTPGAVTEALRDATLRTDGTIRFDFDAPDPAVYLPALTSYVIAPTTGIDTDKGRVLANFLCHGLVDGQRLELTSRLGYARLLRPLTDGIFGMIGRIPGATEAQNCPSIVTPPSTTQPTETTEPPSAPTLVARGVPSFSAVVVLDPEVTRIDPARPPSWMRFGTWSTAEATRTSIVVPSGGTSDLVLALEVEDPEIECRTLAGWCALRFVLDGVVVPGSPIEVPASTDLRRLPWTTLIVPGLEPGAHELQLQVFVNDLGPVGWPYVLDIGSAGTVSFRAEVLSVGSFPAPTPVVSQLWRGPWTVVISVAALWALIDLRRRLRGQRLIGPQNSSAS